MPTAAGGVPRSIRGEGDGGNGRAAIAEHNVEAAREHPVLRILKFEAAQLRPVSERALALERASDPSPPALEPNQALPDGCARRGERPPVMWSGPYRFFFYSGDGAEPLHIHVEREHRTAKFWLDPIRLQWASGFRPVELREIERIIEKEQSALVEAWHDYFQS